MRHPPAGTLIAVLSILVAACAQQANQSPAPSPSAGPSAASSPAATGPAASGPLPSTSLAPVGELPNDLPTSASATRDGVSVSIEVASAPLRTDEAVEVTLKVRNVGNRDVQFLTDGCEIPVSAYGLLTGPSWIGSLDHEGVAAEFKAASLEPVPSGLGDRAFGFDDPLEQNGAGCADIGIVKTLPAGSIITRKVTWTGDAAENVPPGPAFIVAAFPYHGHVGDPGNRSHEPVVAYLESWVDSDAVPPSIPLGVAIDLALADPDFAEWLADKPSSTWVNPHNRLDVELGTWRIGLFRDLGTDYGSVTLDMRTGEVLDHRFE